MQNQPAGPSSGNQREFAIYAIAGIVLSFELSAYRAYVWSHYLWNAQAFGYATASCLLAALIAYAIAGRKKVRSGIRFAFWTVLISVFYLLLELGSRKS